MPSSTATTHRQNHPNPFSSTDIDRYRAFPYARLLPALGCKQSSKDVNIWFSPLGTTICVERTGLQKFTDVVTKKAGGGAIDLVMHIRSVSFLNAVRILSELSSLEPAGYAKGEGA